MQVFYLNGNKLKRLERKEFYLEKEIQKICEENLKEIFGLEFVKSEFHIKNFRIDTLAFDSENKSFIIIEYKKDKNFSIVDQGTAYLSLLLQHQADFVLEYQESKNKNLLKKDIDWSQSKIIFVAPFFTIYQKQSINFDLPIELWEIKRYENGVIIFNQVESSEKKESIQRISKGVSENRLLKKIKSYTEKERVNKSNERLQEIYYRIKEYILSLGDDIKIKPQKHYIAFIRKNNFCDIVFQKKSLKIFLNMEEGKLIDYEKIARVVKNIGHWGNGDYEIHVDESTNLEYLYDLIKQSYNVN